MPSLKLYDMNAKEVGAIELSDLFDMEYNEPLIHQAVVTRLANERQGTKSTLTRSEVRGGGAKPWRQKGTGRARQGSIRSPQWVKGGVVFAPKSRDFSKKMNVMARRIAIFSALSQKVRDGEMIVIDEIAVAAQAVSALDRIQNRTAEWYYLYGLCYMRQGMYSRAQQAFQTAANMEPGNMEYRQAAEQMRGVYEQAHERTVGGNSNLLCNVLQCLACMSLCGGGRLIFCC